MTTTSQQPGQGASHLAGAPQIGPPAVQSVLELGWGMWVSSVVQAAAQLCVADAVDGEAATAEEIAERVGADPDALGRLLRTLAGLGVFRQVEGCRYVHTESSRALRSDHPSRLADIMRTGSDWGWTLWGLLGEAVRTGECAFRTHYGKDLIDYFMEDNPDAGVLCHRGYSAQAEAMNPALVAALDVADGAVVADIGGGQGSLMRALLEHRPGVQGVLFDVEPVLAEAAPELREGPLAARCRLVAGDVMASVPVAADVYVFRQVLHMWDDDTCVTALRNCADAAGAGARVVLFEQLVSDPPEDPFDGLMDLHMLLVMGGRERSEREYAALLERAGLRYLGFNATTGTPLRVIEATVPR